MMKQFQKKLQFQILLIQIYAVSKRLFLNKMISSLLFGSRHGVSFFDLKKTLPFTKRALSFLKKATLNHSVILLIGSHTLIIALVWYLSVNTSHYSISNKWVGVTLTNWTLIKKYVKFLYTTTIAQIRKKFILRIEKKIMLVFNPLEQFQVDSLFNFFYFDGTSFFDIAYSNYTITICLLFTFLVVSANIYVLILFILNKFFIALAQKLVASSSFWSMLNVLVQGLGCLTTSFNLMLWVSRTFFKYLIANQKLQKVLLIATILKVFAISTHTFSIEVAIISIALQLIFFLLFKLAEKINLSNMIQNLNESYRYALLYTLYVVFILSTKNYILFFHLIAITLSMPAINWLKTKIETPRLLLELANDVHTNNMHLKVDFPIFEKLRSFSIYCILMGFMLFLGFPEQLKLFNIEYVVLSMMLSCSFYGIAVQVIRMIITCYCNPIVNHKLWILCGSCAVLGTMTLGVCKISNNVIIMTPMDVPGNRYLQIHQYGFWWKTSGEGQGVHLFTSVFPGEAVPVTVEGRVDLLTINKRLKEEGSDFFEGVVETQNPLKEAFYKKKVKPDSSDIIPDPNTQKDLWKRFHRLNESNKAAILKTMSELEDIDKPK